MNAYAVVTNEETNEKFAIGNDDTRPKVSILSPALMAGVSRDYLVYSAADIISHLIEVYFTAKVQPNLQSRLVESLINTVIETTERLLANPSDEDARRELARDRGRAPANSLGDLPYPEPLGYIPPAEAEANYYRQLSEQPKSPDLRQSAS